MQLVKSRFEFFLRFITFTGLYALINEAFFFAIIILNIANLGDFFKEINFSTWFFYFRLPVYALNGLLDLALCRTAWQQNALLCRNQLILTSDVLIGSLIVIPIFNKLSIYIGLWIFFRYSNVAILYYVLNTEANNSIVIPFVLAVVTYLFVNLSIGVSRKLSLWILKVAHCVSQS